MTGDCPLRAAYSERKASSRRFARRSCWRSARKRLMSGLSHPAPLASSSQSRRCISKGSGGIELQKFSADSAFASASARALPTIVQDSSIASSFRQVATRIAVYPVRLAEFLQYVSAVMQPVVEIREGECLINEIALRPVAAVRSQEFELRARLDPFGHNLDIETARHGDDRLRYFDVVRIGREVLHKASIDLDVADREALQIADRRVARAEVVDRQADAHRSQILRLGNRDLHVFHEGALGELH